MITDRMALAAPFGVRVPADFTDLDPRGAIDQALNRLTRAGHIRKVVHDIYVEPDFKGLTGKPTVGHARHCLAAVSRFHVSYPDNRL